MPGTSQVIEIVGVAGSGKSTLTRVLRGDYGCRVADSLHTRLPAHWPYVAHGVPGLVPILARSLRCRPLLSWDEVKFVLYAAEWHRFLRPERRRGGATIVLDQGPIFALACLLWGRKPVTRSARFDGWLRRMVERWSVELDAIALLDASDDTLLGRIDEREQGHEAKGKGGDGLRIIGRHREAYGRVLELVESVGRLRIVRFDSGAASADVIAHDLAATLGIGRAAKVATVGSTARLGET